MTERRLFELPVTLTSFAYRGEYLPELENMLTSVNPHHGWAQVMGRGPVAGRTGSLLVSTPDGDTEWRLPVPLVLDGENDWRLVTRMKGWWFSEVWNYAAQRAGGGQIRVLWLDADARLNGPLDFPVDPDAEVIAAPWYHDKRFDYRTLTTGLMFCQGRADGVVAELIEAWKNECLRQIVDLRMPIVPWLDGDQEVLTETLASLQENGRSPVIIPLEYEKYCGCVTLEGVRKPGALVDQWMMSWRMKKKEYLTRAWPPAEELRRGTQGV